MDALDEGDENEVRSMVEFVTALARTAKYQDTSFEICFASRHYPTISASSCEELIVENQAEHAKDIAQYVRSNLHMDNGIRKDDFVHKVEQTAEGVFRWAILIVAMLNRETDHGASKSDLMAILKETPTDLYEVLQNILHSGASDKYYLGFWYGSSHAALCLDPWALRNSTFVSNLVLVVWTALSELCLSYLRASGGHLDDVKIEHRRRVLLGNMPLVDCVLSTTLEHLQIALEGGVLEMTTLHSFPLRQWIKIYSLCGSSNKEPPL